MTEREMERKLDEYCEAFDENCTGCKFRLPGKLCTIGGDIVSDYNLVFNPSTRGNILDAAKQCVTSDRENQYGSPEDNFKLIAEFWQSYLKGRSVPDGVDLCILPQDVAVMMTLLKIARIKTGTFKEDSFVDACGYLACAAELAKG